MDAQNDTITSGNLLAHDPELYAESFNHEDDEYVWPDRAAKYLEDGELPEDDDIGELDESTEPVTAAGTPEEGEMEFPSPLYFTVDDNDNVLELVKADDEGLFIRIEGKWVDISDEEEFPTVYEQTIKFANDESVGKWDAEFEDNDALKLEDIQEFIIE
jgi:hypothetical protein